MRRFELTILGSNSALPAYGRFPTSQYLNISNSHFLIDCGEGCQIRMSQYKVKRNKISHIFISHLHGDHLYGLPGVIGSMNHLSRNQKLTIYGPPGLKDYLDTCFRIGEVRLNFDIEINDISLDAKTLLWENDDIRVSGFPVDHRIQCFGYLFEENQQLLNVRKEAINKFDLSIEEIIKAKNAEAVMRGQKRIPQDMLTYPKQVPRSYAYCADSRSNIDIIPFIQDVDLLYFESTYLDDLKEEAHVRGHSTARQAGEMALHANAKKLIIGHYSSRYKDVQPLLTEAKSIFENTELAYDGAMINL